MCSGRPQWWSAGCIRSHQRRPPTKPGDALANEAHMIGRGQSELPERLGKTERMKRE